jgi:hypothetical protein
MRGHHWAVRFIIAAILLFVFATATNTVGDGVRRSSIVVHATDSTEPIEVVRTAASIKDTSDNYSQSELETVTTNAWNAKMDVLVEKWYIVFSTKCSGLGMQQAQVLREQVLVECEKEMSEVTIEYTESKLSYNVSIFC